MYNCSDEELDEETNGENEFVDQSWGKKIEKWIHEKEWDDASTLVRSFKISFPNFHSLSHLGETLLMMGSVEVQNAAFFETNIARPKYTNTNHHNVGRDVLKSVSERQAMQLAQSDESHNDKEKKEMKELSPFGIP